MTQQMSPSLTPDPASFRRRWKGLQYSSNYTQVFSFISTAKPKHLSHQLESQLEPVLRVLTFGRTKEMGFMS